MATSWNVEITQLPNGDVGFRPNLPNAAVGDDLGADIGDTVTWSNRTNQTLTLVSIDPPNKFLAHPIPAGAISDPPFAVVDQTLRYRCVNPPRQEHSIIDP